MKKKKLFSISEETRTDALVVGLCTFLSTVALMTTDLPGRMVENHIVNAESKKLCQQYDCTKQEQKKHRVRFRESYEVHRGGSVLRHLHYPPRYDSLRVHSHKEGIRDAKIAQDIRHQMKEELDEYLR